MNQRYRIKNWQQYNQSLIQRGSITFWFSEDVIARWYSSHHTCKKGRPQTYSDEAILCALMIRIAYGRPLRAVQGFLISIVALMGLSLPIPSYTQLCRRANGLGEILKKFSNKRIVNAVFDSTGLKVYGEGEWKVRQHGISKRRTWRKLHIAIDPDNGEILLSELTENGKDDAKIGAQMLPRLPKTVKNVFGDGAYDKMRFRMGVQCINAHPYIPPNRNAIVHSNAKGALAIRDEAVLQIKGLGGDDKARKMWKQLKGYHKRSLVETMMYRIKQLTGGKLRSRLWGTQQCESKVKCLVINKMTSLGMPMGIWEQVA